MAEALDISLDELLIGQPATKNPGKRGPASRLQQQLAAIEAMPRMQQKIVAGVIDTFIAQYAANTTEQRTG